MIKRFVEFLYRGFFGEPEAAPVVQTHTVDTPNFAMVQKNITQITLVLDQELAGMVEGLAADMQTNVHDILIRMIKIANVIRVEKLYGIPSVSGNYLGVTNRKTNEFLKINLDCAVKGDAPKEELPPKVSDKKWSN